MKNAGIEWVRMDVPFPFEGRVGNLSGNFKKFYEKLSEFGAQGFKVMGINSAIAKTLKNGRVTFG